jgi:hypothetical protein
MLVILLNNSPSLYLEHGFSTLSKALCRSLELCGVFPFSPKNVIPKNYLLLGKTLSFYLLFVYFLVYIILYYNTVEGKVS